MPIGIVRLPYSADVFAQVAAHLGGFDGEIVFIDESPAIERLRNYVLLANCSFLASKTDSADELAARCAALKLDNAISFTDLGLMPAARVRESLDMRGHGVETELVSVDKY
ncbi:hypothetical protein BPMI_00596c [Candidatus Burkholderia pumila]|uniref:Uncharacterized protein n=1 Tax=Candidatus Burkholderia pumila TaxID=1090375 RepID=A0ABR5HKC3_9BURK|nr:hypothetical protein BPMI_00596c [Candidatus Burkholderia pumila]